VKPLKKSTSTTCSEEKTLVDDETWVNILEPELCKDSAAVESLTRLLFLIKREINSGPVGVLQASKILSNGTDVMYLYTKAHKAALELFVLSLGGELKPQDEPLNLITAAIKRGKQQAR
jgi:hypothetical protein